MSQKNDINKNNIYDLYSTYFQYKFYYDFYWSHNNSNVITDEDIDREIKNVYESKRPLEGPIEALCFFAQISKSDLFNKDGTPKDINYIEVLNMIKEANYGEIDD